MTKEELFKRWNRPGWQVTGERDEVKPAVDAKGQSLGDQPTGNKIWTISSPDGRQTDEVIVKASRFNPDDPIPENFTPIKGPTHEVPAPSTSTTSPSAVNEAALNEERAQNAANSKWGRVTNAERAALEARERTEGRQLTNDERNATLAASREDRLVRAEDRQAAAQEASNAISRSRLALDQQKFASGDIQTIKGEDGSTNLVRVKPDGSTEIVFSMPAGIKTEKTQDGTIIAYNPANPTDIQVIWRPEKAPELLPGQKPDQRQFIQRDPRTGELTAIQNPLPPVAQQRWQELQDGITAIEGMWARGEITPTEAEQYRVALKANFDASLQGTTPYQQNQDKLARQQQRMRSGADLLNQRVSSGSGLAQSLLSSAVGIVSNKNFMDPSAVAGFSPFAGARDYVTELGGGQGVYDAAAGAVKSGLSGGEDDPAAALLKMAIGGGGQPAVAPPAGMTSTPVGENAAIDPGLALLQAAIGRYRQPEQYDPSRRQRGPIFG